MHYIKTTTAFAAILLMISCSKNDAGQMSDPCAGITIAINGSVTNTTGPGKTDGAISATATGASGISFNINGGAFQSSGSFGGLAAGTYTIQAKTSQGCSSTATFTIADGDPCAGKTITVTGSLQASESCSATGSITASATGSTNFTYRLDASGTYQSSPTFTNVAAGTYTLYAKDGSGCEKTTSVTITTLPNGTLFNAVKNLLQAKCSACHISTTNGGANFGTDCNIVTLKDRIKARAVDAGDMPQGGPALNATEKKIITDWIDAGGRASN